MKNNQQFNVEAPDGQHWEKLLHGNWKPVDVGPLATSFSDAKRILSESDKYTGAMGQLWRLRPGNYPGTK